MVYQNGGYGYVPRTTITNGTAASSTSGRSTSAALLRGPATETPTRTGSSARHSSESREPSLRETYLCIGPFDSKTEAESVLSYLSCRLTRFLILLHKPSQHTTRKVYTFVPTQEWTRRWTDEDLYAKYGLYRERDRVHREDRPPDGITDDVR